MGSERLSHLLEDTQLDREEPRHQDAHADFATMRTDERAGGSELLLDLIIGHRGVQRGE